MTLLECSDITVRCVVVVTIQIRQDAGTHICCGSCIFVHHSGVCATKLAEVAGRNGLYPASNVNLLVQFMLFKVAVSETEQVIVDVCMASEAAQCLVVSDISAVVAARRRAVFKDAQITTIKLFGSS